MLVQRLANRDCIARMGCNQRSLYDVIPLHACLLEDLLSEYCTLVQLHQVS